MIDPLKDFQQFINKTSTFPNNERLRKLYKEAGQYIPYTDGEELNMDESFRGSFMRGSRDSGHAIVGMNNLTFQLANLEKEKKKKEEAERVAKLENEMNIKS
jgi:hypothetical protein